MMINEKLIYRHFISHTCQSVTCFTLIEMQPDYYRDLPRVDLESKWFLLPINQSISHLKINHSLQVLLPDGPTLKMPVRLQLALDQLIILLSGKTIRVK